MAVVEIDFPAMGSRAHVTLVGAPPSVGDAARSRIAELESLWSRFIADSELSRLNRSSGIPVEVGDDTFELISRSVEAWSLTKGLFDPTVHDAVIAAGYREDFARLSGPDKRTSLRPSPGPAPGLAGVALDAVGKTVTFPVGVRVDPGGIGKGLAADIVTREAVSAGASGALVNIGGDLCARGDSGTANGWVISIEDPLVAGGEIARVSLNEGALATSTRVKRRWKTPHGVSHHLIDSRSGKPAWPGVAQATVIAGDGWWAEALAKAAFFVGVPRGPRMLAAVDAVGLVIDDSGERHDSPGFEEFSYG